MSYMSNAELEAMKCPYCGRYMTTEYYEGRRLMYCGIHTKETMRTIG
jgi:hypothetical protein